MRFGNHAAGCVRNATRNALFSPCAGGVWDLASAGLLDHVADGVRNLSCAGLSGEAAGGVRNLLHTLHGNLSANGVRHLAVADFGNHASAGDCFLNDFWNPFAAADCGSGALYADLFAAAGIAGVAHTFFHDRTRDMSSLGDPFTAALVNRAAFGYRLERRVTNVLPAGFGFCFPAGGADIAVAGLVDRFANVVANRAIAGLVHGFADRVANIAVARLIDGLANTACHVAVARLVDGLADRVRTRFVAGLVNRLTNRVAFVTVAGFVDVFDAVHWSGFSAVIEDRLHAVVLLGFPDDLLLHAAVCRSTAAGGDEISAGRTCGRGTAEKSARTEQTGHQYSAVQQYRNCSSGSQHEPLHCLTSIISGRLKRFRTKGENAPPLFRLRRLLDLMLRKSAASEFRNLHKLPLQNPQNAGVRKIRFPRHQRSNLRLLERTFQLPPRFGRSRNQTQTSLRLFSACRQFAPLG